MNEPHVADELYRRASQLAESEQWGEAIAAASKAAAIYRKLLPLDWELGENFSAILVSLGSWLVGTGDRKRALAIHRESVDVHRQQASGDPWFEPKLAHELIRYGNLLTDLGKLDEALGLIAEAVWRYEALASEDPAFEANLEDARQRYQHLLG